jgi:hypothetical protein
MIVRLSQPIEHNGRMIDQVTVRVPPETQWDANPEDIDQSLWNFSHIVGLPIDAVTLLAAPDVEAIVSAWAEVEGRWNVAASGEFTSHRAFRRRSNRR